MSIRDKHRFLRTAWLVLTLLLVGLMVYVLYPVHSLTFVLLSGYMVAVILFVVYEAVLLKELYLEKKRDWFSIHNSWMQLYIGSLSLLAAAVSFAFAVILGVKAELALAVFIGLTLLLLLSTYSYVERVVKGHLPKNG